MGKPGEERPDVCESSLKKARHDPDLAVEEDLEEGGEDLLAEGEVDTCVYGDEVVQDDDDEEEEEEEEDVDDSQSEEEDVDEELVRYSKQLFDSDGFDVDFVPQSNEYLIGLVYPIYLEDPLHASFLPKVDACAREAVKHFNRFRRRNLEFVKARKLVAGHLFYITFQAKDLSSGELKTYQTKVYYRFDDTIIKVNFFRTKPENLEART